jgi:hypothetical protein
VAEWLFDDDSRAMRASGARELLNDYCEKCGRNCEIMRRPSRCSEFLAQGPKRCRVRIIPVNVAQQSRELVEGGGINASAVLLETVAGASLQLIQIPACLGHTDHGNIEVPALQHRLQRREDLLVRQVAGGAEEDQRIGMGVAHRMSLSVLSFAGGFFEMAAELVAHRRKQLVLEVRLAP